MRIAARRLLVAYDRVLWCRRPVLARVERGRSNQSKPSTTGCGTNIKSIHWLREWRYTHAKKM